MTTPPRKKRASCFLPINCEKNRAYKKTDLIEIGKKCNARVYKSNNRTTICTKIKNTIQPIYGKLELSKLKKDELKEIASKLKITHWNGKSFSKLTIADLIESIIDIKSQETNDTITIYTDGSCLKNPNGPGGWALCALDKNQQIDVCICGGDPSTTNNRMELQAIIESLKAFPLKNLHIYSDSKYVINCATGKFKRKANIDMWHIYDKYAKGITLTFTWVRAHNGNKYNEIVDKLSREEAKKYLK